MPIFNNLQVSGITSAGDAIQVTEMPEASYEELDKIYQYVGETNEYYTNGYFYKCIVIYDNYLSDESGDESGESGVMFSWERIDVQPPFAIEKAEKYKEYDATHGWKFDTGFGELTLYTVNEIPEEGEILYQAETYAVPGITLKSATTGLVVPYVGWVKVKEYLPAEYGLPDRILITVGGITPLIPNTDSYTQPVLYRVTQQ